MTHSCIDYPVMYRITEITFIIVQFGSISRQMSKNDFKPGKIWRINFLCALMGFEILIFVLLFFFYSIFFQVKEYQSHIDPKSNG